MKLPGTWTSNGVIRAAGLTRARRGVAGQSARSGVIIHQKRGGLIRPEATRGVGSLDAMLACPQSWWSLTATRPFVEGVLQVNAPADGRRRSVHGRLWRAWNE